jgi:hypothetical protein
MRNIWLSILAAAGMLLTFGCGDASQNKIVKKVPGMEKYDYLATDGGPAIVLPVSLSTAWVGYDGIGNPLAKNHDYGRACAVQDKIDLIKVGSGKALVIQNPPMCAWAKAPAGQGIDIIVLEMWSGDNLDALIETAQRKSAGKFSDTGLSWNINCNDITLQYAGDPGFGVSAYGRYPIPVKSGTYKIMKFQYNTGKDNVYIYRLIRR